MVKPQVFEAIVPRALPSYRVLVYASGIAELACAAALLHPRALPSHRVLVCASGIACAAALLHPRTRAVAGLASAALRVAVLPANV